MDSKTTIIPVQLSNGKVIKVEATPIGEQQVVSRYVVFKETIETIKTITSDIAESLYEIQAKVKPDKVGVTFGLEVAIESGEITTLIVKGSSKGNLSITLEWNNS